MKSISNSLFWRLSLFFLMTLTILASIYIYITYTASLEYSEETSQKLNKSLAGGIADHTKPFIQGDLNEEEVKHIFHSAMIANPAIEVYLLDTKGKILSFHAPRGRVQVGKLNLDPIHTFIENNNAFVKGEDPRNPGIHKVFSAAEILDDGKKVGYIYVILSGDQYATVASMLNDSFKMKLATKTILIILVATFFIGMLIIWFLTRNLNKIISTVKDFERGNTKARIHLKSKGELSVLTNNFNSMADTVEKNINDLKSAENFRKELIANISHDLRTPLTSIQGYAETLVMLDQNIDNKARIEYANIILSSTEKVKKLVDDLFEISKLEADVIETNMESFSVKEMLSDIVMKYDLIAKSKGVNLKFKIDKQDALIYGDVALIDRVIQNLIDNAIKHTDKAGSVTIAIEKEGNNVKIIVEDTGVGIPQGEIPFIFDRYKKVTGNSRVGSGLGLAIVKKILELHKTDIFVSSIENRGTIFSFSLPVVS